MSQTPINKIFTDLVEEIIAVQERLPVDSWEYGFIENMHGKMEFTEKQRDQIRRIADHLKII